LPPSLIVTQSNTIVEARYNLPLGEQRLILTMISKIQPEDEDFKPYRISVKEFTEFLGIDTDSAYRECKKITEKLLTRVINVEESDGLLQIGWLSAAKYIDGSGMVNLSFDPLLKSYLLQLKSGFTSCKLTMLLSFKSQYTMRIYTLLKQYQKLKTREIEMPLLREMLGIRVEQYKRYNDFKKDVLERTKKELIEKADLYFEFDEIKYGRKIGALEFHIFTKKIEKTINPPPNSPPSFTDVNTPENTAIEQLLLLIPVQHRTRKTIFASIVSFERKKGFEYVKRNILYSNAKAAKSYAGFINNALKNDWGLDWEVEQKIPVKKKVHEVWERQGFSSQKEYDDVMFQRYLVQIEQVKQS